MKKAILAILAVAAMAALSHGQGTIVFANGAGSVITYGGVNATTAMGVKAQFWYAPVGTTDPALFTALAGTTTVGTFFAGRFSGGTMTIPGIAPPGGNVAAIVRVFTGPDWVSSVIKNQSGIFVVDTGDPTTVGAPGTPAPIAGLFGPIEIVPEPASMALVGISAATLLFFRRLKSELSRNH